MNTERILVTGATGFTGGHLYERLAGEGYAVRALVRQPQQCAGLQQWGGEVVVGDLCTPRTVAAAMQGVDVVYHIAALFRPENVSRQEMWETNVQGTQNLLDAAIKAGVRRFVHCSTVGVHGDIRQPPATEETPYGPGDHYQASKAAGERLVLEYMRAGRLPIVVFRPGGIYGPRDRRFLKLFKSIQMGTFVMLGTGNVLYQMIYIDDLIDGILRCGTNQRAIGNVYILTGAEPTTLRQLVQVIAEVLGVRPPWLRFPVTPVYVAGVLCELLCKPLGIQPPLYRRRVDFFRKTRCFDIAKAARELGFSPRTTLRTGMGLTAAWYRQQGLL
jgi:nucleoside-diphosphate-sugar epimerase